jgi:hypothetical protein
VLRKQLAPRVRIIDFNDEQMQLTVAHSGGRAYGDVQPMVADR